MIKTTVKFDPKRSSELYDTFFAFERNKILKTKKLPTLVFAGLLILLLGILFDFPFVKFGGTFLVFLALAIYLYYFIKYERMTRMTTRHFYVMDIASERKFVYQFDENVMAYDAPNSYREVKWNLIKEFVLNGDVAYVFYERHILYDIISEAIIGEANFKEFCRIAEAKVNV